MQLDEGWFITMRVRSLIAVLGIFVMFAAIEILPVHAANFSSPQAMLTTYYNDISLHQFQAAFAMWINPPQSYDNFVAGYSDTDHVTPYLSDYQSVNSSAGFVPGVLVGYHTDGSVIAYHGCFNVAFNATGWAITGASFDNLANTLPDNGLILAYLGIDCRSNVIVFPTAAPSPTPNGLALTPKAYSTLAQYYELINRKDFAGAYALWLHPLDGPKPNGAPPQDYRLPYNDFISGYATTKFVDVYPGFYDEEGGSAGHGYLDGKFPVMLIGEHTDGTYVGYVGCYVMGGMQGVPFGIVSGAFKQISNGPDVPSLYANLPMLKTICNDLGASLGL